MRTDSNTLLSLSSDIQSKAKKSPKMAKEDSTAFESDFNKAKEALDRKSSPAGGGADSSKKAKVTDAAPKSVDSVDLSEKSAPLESNEESVVSNEASEESDLSAIDSGKGLQLEGDQLPVASSSDSDFEAELVLSTTLNPDIQEVTNTSLDVSSDVKVSSIDGVSDIDSLEIPVATSLPLTSLSSKDSDVAVNPLEKLDPSGVLVSSEGLESSKGSEGLESSKGSEDLLYDGSELSWVLSQMDSTNTKTVPKNDDVASDVVKSGVIASGLLASSVNKNGRPEAGSVSTPVDANIAGSVGDINTDTSETLLLDDGLLIDEPIELRKKELDAMIGRMSAQVDGRVVDDSATGGLNSSLQNNGVTRSAIGLGAVVNNQPANLTMNLPPSHPGWANEIGQKVAWIARDGGHTAHIRLDPPELGSLTVKVSVDNDSNTQVSFIAATPQARDLLESQMSRLRDMLAQQGMDLSRADVDVSQQDTSGTQKDTEQNNSSNRNALASQDDIDDDLISSNVSYVSATGVDYYA